MKRCFEYGTICERLTVVDKEDVNPIFHSFADMSLLRFLDGDWGESCAEDVKLNEEALLHGGAIAAAYRHRTNPDWRIWIVTNAERTMTTVMLADEY
nr:MAG TPA: hypothetical protein [Caudoviricetes sp.]